MGPQPDDFFSTPEQHFMAFDRDDALFVSMDRGTYHRSIFLDGRVEALDPRPTRIALAPLIAAAQGRAIPRIGWIFHVAHCGSTMLSRLIDRIDGGLVLREPPPLRQLGLASASGRVGEAQEGRLRLAIAMAGRRFDAAQPAVVKANVPVNFILPDLLAFDPGAPAILLYFALEPYLLAVLGSDSHRGWVDRLTVQLGAALGARVGLAKDATTAERAAALWLAQMAMFDAALRAYPATRSLDAERLFADPASAAAAVAGHLGLAVASDSLADPVVTSTYSKDPSRRFDEGDRQALIAQRRMVLQDEIAKARRWIETAPATRNLPTCLGRPLIGKSASLLA